MIPVALYLVHRFYLHLIAKELATIKRKKIVTKRITRRRRALDEDSTEEEEESDDDEEEEAAAADEPAEKEEKAVTKAKPKAKHKLLKGGHYDSHVDEVMRRLGFSPAYALKCALLHHTKKGSKFPVPNN